MEDIGVLGTAYVMLYWSLLAFAAFTTFLLLPMCLLWAPVGGFISVSQARRGGSDIWLYYGLVGALYSIALFVPWVYLTLRLSGKKVAPKIVKLGYVMIYATWTITLVFTFTLLLADLGDNLGSPLPALAIPAIWLITLIGVVAIPLSIRKLVQDSKANDHEGALQHSSNNYRHKPRDFLYLTPFVFAAVQLVAYPWSIFT